MAGRFRSMDLPEAFEPGASRKSRENRLSRSIYWDTVRATCRPIQDATRSERLLRILHRFLILNSRWSATTWIGYSMGGRVALAAAIERPERVGSLVLESVSPGLKSEVERAARRSLDAALAERIVQGGIKEFAQLIGANSPSVCLSEAPVEDDSESDSRTPIEELAGRTGWLPRRTWHRFSAIILGSPP